MPAADKRDGDGADVDVNDPDFWRKVVGVVHDVTEDADWGASAGGRRRRGAAAMSRSYRDPSLRDMMSTQSQDETTPKTTRTS